MHWKNWATLLSHNFFHLIICSFQQVLFIILQAKCINWQILLQFMNIIHCDIWMYGVGCGEEPQTPYLNRFTYNEKCTFYMCFIKFVICLYFEHQHLIMMVVIIQNKMCFQHLEPVIRWNSIFSLYILLLQRWNDQ